MSEPLCNLYVEAGSPLGEMDGDNVNQWAYDIIANALQLNCVGFMHPLDLGRGGMCLPEEESDEMIPVYAYTPRHNVR